MHFLSHDYLAYMVSRRRSDSRTGHVRVVVVCQGAGDLDELVKRGLHFVEDIAVGASKTVLAIQSHIPSLSTAPECTVPTAF